MKFDDLLTGHLGEFGRYQKQQYALLSLTAICSAAQILIPVFTAVAPPFGCAMDDSGLEIQSNSTRVDENYTVSSNQDGTCFFTIPKPWNTSHLTETVPCSEFVFDTSEMYSTIVTDWSLVCERKYLSTLSSMLYMAGVMVGSFVAGTVSDRFGRRKSLLIALFIQGASGSGAAAAPEICSYVTFRFITGGASVGVYLIAYVLAVELVGPSKRHLTAIILTTIFSIAYFICSGVAFALRHWRAIQLAVSVPSFILVIIYYWLVKESPRWLYSKGRVSESKEILRRAFEVNKVPMPAEGIYLDTEESSDKLKQKLNLRQAFKSKVLLKRTTAVIINWTAISMCYYGLSYNTRNLSGSIFINLMLSGLVEFPAEVAVFFGGQLGRKAPHIFGMILGGASCASTLFLVFFAEGDSYDWLYIALNMAGKFGITIAYCTIYSWSAELYPTVFRNSLMGVSSACARVGSILAPLIADAGKYVDGDAQKILAPLIFSISAIVAGLISFALPETSGKALPDTTHDTSTSKRPRLKFSDVAEKPMIKINSSI